jgi:hypothetical protein
MIHADNSRCHTAKVVLDCASHKRIRFAPHPPYSPDVAPSDFFLFGYLKPELSGCFFRSTEELLAEIYRLVEAIPSETFSRVFDEWIQRCEGVIAAD